MEWGPVLAVCRYPRYVECGPRLAEEPKPADAGREPTRRPSTRRLRHGAEGGRGGRAASPLEARHAEAARRSPMQAGRRARRRQATEISQSMRPASRASRTRAAPGQSPCRSREERSADAAERQPAPDSVWSTPATALPLQAASDAAKAAKEAEAAAESAGTPISSTTKPGGSGPSGLQRRAAVASRPEHGPNRDERASNHSSPPPPRTARESRRRERPSRTLATPTMRSPRAGRAPRRRNSGMAAEANAKVVSRPRGRRPQPDRRPRRRPMPRRPR